MGAPATTALINGINLEVVACSFRRNSTALDRVRDGKSGIVTSATRASAGQYEVLLSRKYPRMVAGFATLNGNTSDSNLNDVYVFQVRYDEATGKIHVAVRNSTVGPGSAEIPDLSRLSVFAVFSVKDATKDAL